MEGNIEIIEIKIEKETLKKEKIKPPFNFDTTQNSLVIPTKDLIKHKDCDFRVILGISGLSNCEDVTKEGGNSRYITVDKLNRRAKSMCDTIGIDISNFNKKIRTIIKKKSDEFKVLKINDSEGYHSWNVMYKINAHQDECVYIPINIAEKIMGKLSSNAIKVYCVLIYLSLSEDGFESVAISQNVISELIGLSKNSEKVIRSVIDELIQNNLINMKLINRPFTSFNDDNIPYIQTRCVYEYKITDKELIECNKPLCYGVKSIPKSSKKTKDSRCVRNDIGYIKWKLKVMKRDNNTCRMCGITKDDSVLHVHHIKKYSKHKELRTNINNGITLCYECHSIITGNEEKYENMLLDIINKDNTDVI